ncbi:MAG: type II secretion system protein [Deltaproteobacteria bacterium]|nr:type II secretion system protein [Deltaproteobacteria bacterium]
MGIFSSGHYFAKGPPGPEPTNTPLRGYYPVSSIASPGLPVAPQKQNGFTLIELIAVLAVIGIILALVFPRITGFDEHNLKSDSERISSLLIYLNEASATKKVYYRVWFDLDSDRLDIEVSKTGLEYEPEPETTFRIIRPKSDLEDIVTPGLGRVTTGKAALVFGPLGASEPVAIHLKADEKKLTVSFNPYTGKAAVLEGYIDVFRK